LRSVGGELPYKDRKQQLKYQREWYRVPENGDKIRNKNAERKREIKTWLRELKNTMECEACGEKEPICLDFHHEDEKNKEHNISNMIKKGFSKNRIMEEIEKCVVLCANCHRKYHAGLITLEKKQINGDSDADIQ